MLRFKGNELRPVLEEARAHGCRVILVKDDGVYMMSEIGRKDCKGRQEILAYAVGCNPNVDAFEQWWNTAQCELGGDDFGEYLNISEPVLLRILGSTDDLTIRATQTHIFLETQAADSKQG